MKNTVLIALLTKSASAAVGDPCSKAADCGTDATTCCGFFTGGFVADAKGAATNVPITFNPAVCNVAGYNDDGTKKSQDWTGELKGGEEGKEETIAMKFVGATGFTCFDPAPQPPPAPKPDPPVWPQTGQFSACKGADDTCGGDATLCCGASLNGEATDGTGKPLGKALDAVAICNKKPSADGTINADDWKNKYLLADGVTEWEFTYTGKDFVCFQTATPPADPAAPKNDDPNVGQFCAKTDDCTANVTDDDKKKDYCCGVATNGKLVDANGKTDGTPAAVNSVVCGKTTAIDLQAGYMTADKHQVTIDYPASGFTCLNAKTLVASAAVLLSAAAMF